MRHLLDHPTIAIQLINEGMYILPFLCKETIRYKYDLEQMRDMIINDVVKTICESFTNQSNQSHPMKKIELCLGEVKSIFVLRSNLECWHWKIDHTGILKTECLCADYCKTYIDEIEQLLSRNVRYCFDVSRSKNLTQYTIVRGCYP